MPQSENSAHSPIGVLLRSVQTHEIAATADPVQFVCIDERLTTYCGEPLVAGPRPSVRFGPINDLTVKSITNLHSILQVLRAGF